VKRKITSEDSYSGYTLNHPDKGGRYTYIEFYLYRIIQIMEKALKYHRRVSAFRFDLRLPEGFDDTDSKVITRFFKSLNSKLLYDIKDKEERWSRKLLNKPYYMWSKEKNQSEQYHYHVTLFLNGDIYNKFGDYKAKEGNLAAIIKQAWSSAVKDEQEGLVEFCENGVYYLNRNSPDIAKQKDELFTRLCYLAKVKTKVYGQGMRNFGVSR